MSQDKLQVLSNTPLAFAYGIFFSSSDEQLLTHSVWIYTFVILITIYWNFLGPVAYGKTSNVREGKPRRIWEYQISSRFTWRYGYIPTLIVPWILIIYSPSPYLWNLPNLTALLIHYAHYFNRTIIYPSKISPKAAPSTLWFFLGSVLITTVHTFVQTHHLINVLNKPASNLLFTGLALSLVGTFINYRHDEILTQLRDRGQGYQIPFGGLFQLVSCANYFGELCEWWGYALVTAFGGPQLMFALFSTVFLGLRARYSHNWYKATFGNKYPENRKAIIPFIY